MAEKSIRERMMAGLSKNKSATTGYTAQSKDDIRRRALGGINAGERTRTLRNENRYYTETLKNSPYSSIGSRLDTAIADFNTRVSKMSEYDSDAAGSSDSYAKTLEGIRSDINSLYKDQAYKYAQGLVSQDDMERITGVRTAISQELDDLLQGNKQILKYYDQYADESDFYASAGGQSLNALKGNIEKAQSDYNSKASAYDTASNKRTEYVNARDYIKRYSDPAASTDDDRYFHYTDFLTGETYNIPESLMNDDLYWHYKDFLTGNTFETNDEIENLRSERDAANESYRTQQSEYEKTENRANAVRAEVDARKDPRFDEIANETRFVKSDMSDRKRLEMEVRAYMWPQTDPNASDKKRISAMTDDQLKTLSYLLHKNGRTSEATDYYDHLTDELTATAAEKLAGSYNWFGSRLAHSIPSGIERFTTGVGNALRGTVGAITGDTEPLPEGVYATASPLVRERLGTVGGVVYDVAENIANNAPSMIAGAFNPALGAAMLGTSAGGNAYSEGVKAGMSPAEARVYGVSVGITETMLERYLGTLPGIGKNGFAAKTSEALGEALNTAGKTTIKNVAKKGGLWIAKQLADNSGEFVEESLQEIIEPFIKWAVSSVGGSDVEVDWPGIDDVLYAGFIGIATSMLTNGAANTTAAVYDSIKNREFNSNVRKTGARAIASEAGIKDIQALAAAGIKSDNEYLRAQAQRVQASFADGKFNIKDSEIGKLIYYSELAVMNKQNEISTGSENNIITTIKQAAAVSADEATSIYDSMIAAANGAEVSTELQNIMSTNSSVRQIFEDISSGAETTRILERVKNENGEIVDALDSLAETMSAEAEPEAEYNDPVSVARYDEYGKMIVRDSSGAEFEYNDDSETISGRAKAKLEYAKDFAANGANTYYRLAPNRASETYNATFGLLYNQGIRGEEFHAYENSDISEEKQRAIYDAGRRDAEVDNAAATKANEIAQKKEASRKERTAPARGEVVTSAAVDALIRSTTNKVMQQQYLDTISATEALAKFLGARIEFYVGEADSTGKITSQLGLYNSATNTFRFDILAGTNNIKARTYSAMLRVAGHELTHFIQNWSPTKYNTLKRETLDFLKSEKSDYTEWLREEIRKKQEANAPFGKMTVEQATDEIVSDAFESVLANEGFITKLYASDAGLTKRVNNWVNKYYKQFSEGLKSAFVTDELTEAGKIMRAAGERAQKVYEHWIDAFAHATRNALLFEPQAELIRNMVREAERENREYSKPITVNDVEVLQSIGRKSVNEFTTEDLKKSEKWAYKYRTMGSKSPFFRAWFGEWRAYDTTPMAPVTVQTIDIADATVQSGEYENKDTGWTVRAGKLLEGETKHHTGGERINVRALSSIQKILENSVLLDSIVSSKNSKKKNKNTAFMHKFYAVIKYEGKEYIAKTTIEEYYNETDDNIARRAYHLKGIKIESAGGQLGVSPSSPEPDTDSTHSVADLYKFVKTYDKDFSAGPEISEAALNPDGTPKVFFHGTRSEFDEFLKSAAGRSSMPALAGFWFTDNKAGALAFAENTWYGDKDATVYDVYLSMRNPKIYESEDTTARVAELEKETAKIDSEMSLLDSVYNYDKGERFHRYREYDRSKRRRSNIDEWEPFRVIVEKYDADVQKSYLDDLSAEERKLVKADAERYLELREKRKAFEDKLTELAYSDAYEKFRTDIYRMEGKSAETANIGGVGMALSDAPSAVNKYIGQLRQQGYDSIIIRGTEYDSDVFGGKNNQYVVFDSTQVKSATDNIGTYDETDPNIHRMTRTAIQDQTAKEKQLEIIRKNNPMLDNIHTGIRSVDDIKTFEEAIKDDESFTYGDFSYDDAKKALKNGKITVYSSYPIRQGVFVSTSYNMAKDYAGGKVPYSKTVAIDKVAWINGDEGQFADVDSYSSTKTDNLYRMTREQEREAEERWYDLEARAERGEAANEIIDFLGRGKNKPRIYVPANLSEDIVRWFDVPGRKAIDTLRNRYIGNMTITSDESARGIDSLYGELSEKFGQDWFPDTYDEAQMLLNITKVFDAARDGRYAQMELDSDNIPASPLGLRKKNGYVDPSIRRDLSRIIKEIANRRPKNGAKLLEVLKTYDDALNRYSDALDALTYARKNGDEADITLANTNVQVAEMGLLTIESLPEMSIAFSQVAAMTNSKANSGKDPMTEREAADVKEYYGEARDRKLRKLTQDYRAMLTETERAAKDAIWHAENAERRIERVRQTERKNNVRKDLSKTLSKLTAAKERPTEKASLPAGSDKLYTAITEAIHAADAVMQLRGLPRASSEVIDMIVNASIAQANGTKTHKGVNAEAVNNLISETNSALTALQSRIKAIKSELEALDPQSPAALVRANESDENSRSFVSMLDELFSENISQLYGEDIITYVRDCAETISALSYSLMNANRAMVNGRMVDIIKLRDDLKKGADAMKNSPYKNLPNYFLSPETVFTIYLGETEAKNAFYNLHRDAMMKEIEYKNGASDLISKITNAEELNNPEKLIDSGLEDTAGKPIKLTQDLAIAFILTVAQEDGLRHAVSGGMRLPNIETLYKNPGKAFTEIRETPHIFEKESMERLDELQKQQTEALENGDRTAYFDIGINMTAIRTALGELREKMSDRYREAAKKLESGLDANGRNALNIIRRYYNEYSRAKLDEATMERWGFTKTRKDNYYPIRVVREQIRSDDKNSLIKHDATIESWGPMKNRVVSKNGIYLYGAMSSLGDQINAAARYYSMLNLMNTENKLMLSTFSATNTDNENLTNLKSYIDSLSVREKNGKTQYKESFSSYLDELEMNYVGEHKGESGGFAMKALSMFTRASLFSNFSPVLRQRTAGIQAAPITGFRNAVAALHGKGQKDISTWRRIANTIGIIPMLSKEQVQDVAKYSQLYKYRAGGALNVDFAELKKYKSVNAFLKNRTQETQTKAEKVKSVLLEGGGMELMDMMTLGTQFYACLEAAKQQHPSLDLVEQKKIAGKMLDEVIMTSQPNNADLLKAPLYRRNDAGRLLFGIFTGQPNVMVNSLINKSAAVYSLQKQVQSDPSKVSELKKAKKTLTTASAAIATSVALDTLVGVAVSAIRGFVYDKDDEDKTLGESAIEFTEDYIFGLLGLLPVIGDVAETVRNIWEGKGYYAGNTFSIGALENINDGIRALADLPMKAINGKLTWSAAKKDIADALAIFGISGRMVQVVLRMIELAAGIK